jgi:hypothetical protein
VRVVHSKFVGWANWLSFTIENQVIAGFVRLAIIQDHDLVPFCGFSAGGWHRRLQILGIAGIFPQLIEISTEPSGGPALDFSEDDFGKEIRPVTGTHMDMVLNPTLSFSCCGVVSKSGIAVSKGCPLSFPPETAPWLSPGLAGYAAASPARPLQHRPT